MRNIRFPEKSCDGNLFESRDGFYFRQRKGSLNIRGLESIDLEKLIREVDIDLLQQNLEDLTFCDFSEQHLQFLSDRHIIKLFKVSQLIIEYLLYTQNKLVQHLSELSQKYATKKRTLNQKRKEIAILKEETRNFQDELKLKRRNLRSLQKAVKCATQEGVVGAVTKSISIAPPQTQELILFITFPDGSCIELLAHPKWTISAIDEILRKQFPTKLSLLRKKPHNYFHQGRLLPTDLEFEKCDVMNKDTIYVVAHEELHLETSPIETSVPEIVENDRGAQIIEIVNDQMKAFHQLTIELRAILRDKFSTLPDNPTKDSASIVALEAIQSRLLNIERELQDPPNRNPPNVLEKHIIFGELENDKEDYFTTALNEIKFKLGESCSKVDYLDSKMDALQSLRELVNEQHIQIEELKRMITEQQKPTVNSPPHTISSETKPVPQQSPAAVKAAPMIKTKPIIRVLPRTVDPATNKWNSVVNGPSVEQKVVALEIVDIAPKQPVIQAELPSPDPVVVKPIAKDLVENVSHCPYVAVPDSPSPVDTSIIRQSPPSKESTIAIVFPLQYNNSLLKIGLTEAFRVDLDPGMKDDELIIALRKELSSQTKIPYSYTALKLDSFQIKLAIDVNGLLPSLSAEDASQLASIGRLQVYITRPALTNNQIKVLETMRQVDRKSAKKTAVSSLDTLRLSLNNILESVDKTGLSDDDLLHQRQHLDKLIDRHNNYDLRKSRLSLVKSVGYVTSESDSDFFIQGDSNVAGKGYSDWEDFDEIPRRRSYNSLRQDFLHTASRVEQNVRDSDIGDGEKGYLLDHTIDSEGNGIPYHQKPSEKSILRYADSYEKNIDRSDDSPFDNARTESPDHSLALSDSNNFVDTF